MQIGILQTGRSPDSIQAEQGDYDDLFKDLFAGQDLTFQTFAVLDGDFPSGPEAADGWLITGSRHSAYENLPWIAPLEALIQKIYKADLLMVGICFGHQIIAQALGGTVGKHEGGWAIGPQTYETSDGQMITLNAWHQDQVQALPNTATVLAGNSFCENAVVCYADQVLTFQAHPEFTSDFIAALFEARRGVLPEHVADQAETALAVPTKLDEMANPIRQFFKQRRIAI